MSAPDVTLARDGYTSLLDALVSGWVVYVHLYTNDHTPAVGDTVADYTEPTYDGYEPIAADRWSPAALQGGVAFVVSDPVIFRYSPDVGSAAVRGYYATFGPAGKLLWAWRRPDGPFTLDPDHPLLLVSVRVTFPAPC